MDKKQEILRAAFELFSMRGYHLSLSDLARQAGIKTPSLYGHFESKDQLLEQMIHEEIHRYYRYLDEKIGQIDHLSCKASLKIIFLFVMEYFSENERLRFWRMIPLIPNERLKSTCTSMITDHDHLYFQHMQKCFLKDISGGEIRARDSENALHLYLCMIQGVLDAMLLYPNDLDKNDFAAGIFDTYWEGICDVPIQDRK